MNSVIVSQIAELQRLFEKKSEANKFSIVTKSESLFDVIMTQINNKNQELDNDIILAAAKLASEIRRWNSAAPLWRHIVESEIDTSNTAFFSCAVAHRMLGRLDESESYFSKITKTFRKNTRFQREYERLKKAQSSSFVQRMEKEFCNSYNDKKTVAAKYFAAATLSARGVHPNIVDATPYVINNIISGGAGRELPTVAEDICPYQLSGHVFIGGFGWSGSGAVFDFLRQSSMAFAPFKDTEVSVFDGLPSKPNSVVAFLRKETLDWSEARVFVEGLVLETILALGYAEPLADRGSYANRKSLAVQYSKKDEDADVFSAQLSALSRRIWEIDRGDISPYSFVDYLSVFFVRLLTHLNPADRIAIYNNTIHAYNAAALRCLPGARMVSVFRDPRDQFVAMQYERERGGRISVESFIDLFFQNRKKYKADIKKFNLEGRVLEVKFEEFVQNEAERSRICSELGFCYESFGFNTCFRAEDSGRNIGIHKGYGNQDQIRQIEDRLLARDQSLLCPHEGVVESSN